MLSQCILNEVIKNFHLSSRVSLNIFILQPQTNAGPGLGDAHDADGPVLPLRVHGRPHPGRVPHLHEPIHLLLDEQEGQIRLHGHCR